MLKECEFIIHDFKLPNHSSELSKAEDIIEKFKNRLKIIELQKRIDDKTHTDTYEEIIRVLDYVGRLSQYVFNIEDELEALYTSRYKHSPELSKKLWLDHYDSLHHPYSLLKNRCFRMLEELDAMYYKRHKKHPPNWNP